MPEDYLASLAEWVPFYFDTGYTNYVDAAIASVKKKDVTTRIARIGTPTGTSSALRRGMRVQKYGRTTDYTIGVIRDVDYRTTISYKRSGGRSGPVGFRDQVLCSRYTSGGDSGSAVCSMSGKVVGLHFAGSESSSIFNKIDRVLEALSIEVTTEDF